MTERTPVIFDTSDGQNLRINMISPWLKRKFGGKVVKLALDGGFTCPNRDGSKGTGGCLFCSESGSGDMASRLDVASQSKFTESLSRAVSSQIELLSDKWPDASYLAYFQNHTNTYAPLEVLQNRFGAALQHPAVSGIVIATRPDCISDEVLDYLSELNKKTFMWVELGLQTIHDETAAEMNLCHCRADYDQAVHRLLDRDIRVVTHLILGLPGESRDMMMESVRYVCRDDIFGLKLHMLNVVKGSGMAEKYKNYIPFESMEEYIDILVGALEIVPGSITMHRISGDAPRSTLIAPEWSYRKRTILNNIHKTMRQRNTWQGRLAD